MFKNRNSYLCGHCLSVYTESNCCTSVNTSIHEPFFAPPPHLTLFFSPLTDICVLPLGLSHLTWWCPAFCWPCSCFVCKMSSWMYFIPVLFKVLSQLIMLLSLTCEVSAHSLLLPSPQSLSNSSWCGKQIFFFCFKSVDWLLHTNLSCYNPNFSFPEQQTIFVR